MSSYRPQSSDSHQELRGPEGELVFVRVRVPARTLEEALEVLARASFPVNPEIRHGNTSSTVEFPAYDRNLGEIRNLLQEGGLAEFGFEVASALAAIQ